MTDPRLGAIARRLAAPVPVAVHGRRGVGRGTVAHALTCAGLAVTGAADRAELVVHVVAEVVKPEDRAAIAAARCPVLLVVNKADLLGGASAVGDRCARLAALTGVPTAPMVAVLAVAALDQLIDAALWDAVRRLAAAPADLSCPDAFRAGSHPVPGPVRARLLDTLELFGVAQAVAAVHHGRSAAQLGAALRAASGVDAVLHRVGGLGAQVRYRRLNDGIAELEALAVARPRIGEFLSRDATVAARMAAAVAAVTGAGLPVDGGDSRAAHLRRARVWQHYSRGPVSGVHRSCGADIVRGSLRLWSAVGGAGEAP